MRLTNRGREDCASGPPSTMKGVFTMQIHSSTPPLSPRIIPLTRGCIALVDAEDYERVAALKWCCSSNGYAKRGRGGGGCTYMHRFILGITDERWLDHINGDKLDNRKCNLRMASPTLNGHNRRGANKNSTTGVRGVYWNRQKGKWSAKICPSRRQVHLGFFDSKEEAIRAASDAQRIWRAAFEQLAPLSRGRIIVSVKEQ